ncbi:hypothetical protein, partial [Paraburkholderia caledonica]|uniref:hypothetical protein n=1 Tax=Paraburkholderia caledonica TaxID=134536 RepID=UPI001C5025F7
RRARISSRPLLRHRIPVGHSKRSATTRYSSAMVALSDSNSQTIGGPFYSAHDDGGFVLHKRRVSSEFRKRRMLLSVLVWPVARRLTHETA